MYRIAIDIGGTFTDCVVLHANGETTVVKSTTTPEDRSDGVLEAVRQAGVVLGLDVETLLQQTESFVHGCTVATNAMIERSGARTGLITTRGQEDTILIGRVFQKVAGLSERQIVHISQLHKAEPPLIPPGLISGVSERVDYRGRVIVELNMEDVAAAVKQLVQQGVESIAICLLWSFLNPAHERAIKEYIQHTHPDIFVTASHELIPLLGEYERGVTTAINCYVGPKMALYLDRLQEKLSRLGYRRPLLIMQAGGGLTTVEEAKEKAVLTLDSGPVGGVLGSRFFGRLYDEPNVICTDVGGTSFDVSVIHNGELQLEKQPVIDQYVFKVPKVLIKSIGAGGGSIAWVDSHGLLHVGPQSAGSLPGPACYGRGGLEPTVTDANLVLGYLSPDAFLGGRMTLDRGKAEAALGRLADRMHMDVTQVASGIFSIMNAQMADLVRKCTVERGYDPRDFVLFAYGGAGPTHAALYSTDVGAKAVYVLLDSTAFSAFGMLTSDVLHTAQSSRPLRTPLKPADFDVVNGAIKDLSTTVLRQFAAEGVRAEDVTLRRSILMRYQMQVHELAVDVPEGDLGMDGWEAMETAFEEKYVGIYGPGTAVREAGIELVTYRVDGIHVAPIPEIGRQSERVDADPSVAQKGTRQVYHERLVGFAPTPVYEGSRLRWGQVMTGPAIVERMGDSVLIPPQFRGAVDQYGNIVVEKIDVA